MTRSFVDRFAAPLAAPLIVIAMALTACGTSQSADVSTGATPTTETSQEASETATEPPGTLSDYLGSMGAMVRGGEFSQEQFEAENQLIEREVQLCMQEAGFDYDPGEAGGTFFVASTEDETGSEKEQAERNGFGISTSFDSLTNIDFEIPERPAADPFAEMDPAEMEARNRALWGEDAMRFEVPEGEDPISFEMTVAPEGLGTGIGGCMGEAESNVRGGMQALSAISSQLDELDNRIAADPRVAQITRDWASCMRSAGFTYETRDEAIKTIQSRFEPFIESLFSSLIIVSSDDAQAGPPSGLGGAELTDAQEQELAELQDHERAVAVASLECEGDSRELLKAIDAEYEAVFVEENRALLESLSG